MEEEKFVSIEEEKTLDKNFKREIDNVKQVIMQTTMDFHNYMFPKYISNYKKYLWFVAERMASIDGWQSNVNYPMVSSAVDTMFSNIFDFWYEFWVSDEWLKRLCIKAFDFRNIWKNVFKETAKECLIVGKAYARDYFISETYKDKFFWKEISTEIKTPSMQYLSVFDVMYDKSKTIEESSYKIVRTFMTWDAISNKVLPLILAEYPKELKAKAKNKFKKNLELYKDQFWSRFSMYDYNPVKSLMSASYWYDSLPSNEFFKIPSCTTTKSLLWWYVWNSSDNEDSKNYFLNANKSTYEVVEYSTSTDKYIFINWNLIYFWKKKYQLSQIREITYSWIPWTWNSLWLTDKLWWIQDLQNMLWNAFSDNLKLILWPMFKVTWNFPMAKSWKIDFWAFRVYKTAWWADIEKVQLWVTDFAPMNFMQMNEWVAMKESWMNNYVSGWGWAIERTQAWVDVKFNQYKSKLTPITDSIDQMMWSIARSWIIMFLKFYTKEELKSLDIDVQDVFIKDDKWNEKFDTFKINWIELERILDENNITFTYNSLHKITKENSRDTIIMNLQYLLQYAWGKINMSEISKVLAWKDFNPEKIFYSEEEMDAKKAKQQPNSLYNWQQWWGFSWWTMNFWQQWQQGWWYSWWYNSWQQQGWYNNYQNKWEEMSPQEDVSTISDESLMNQLSNI